MARTKTTKATPTSQIVRDPHVWGGEPVIRGTRVPVSSIVIEWQRSKDVTKVREAFPRVDAAAIGEALAYYDAHREEIDNLIEENEQGALSAD
jgi:uncharacterized protein (DUF433 family)